MVLPHRRQVIGPSRIAGDFGAADLTGLLLYRAALLLQFLEGEQDRLESLFVAIQRDDPSADPIAVEKPPSEGPAPQN